MNESITSKSPTAGDLRRPRAATSSTNPIRPLSTANPVDDS